MTCSDISEEDFLDFGMDEFTGTVMSILLSYLSNDYITVLYHWVYWSLVHLYITMNWIILMTLHES